MDKNNDTIRVLTLKCQDKPGIVAAVASALAACHCNIMTSAQHGDPETGMFFMRVLFSEPVHRPNVVNVLLQNLKPFHAEWDLTRDDSRTRTLIMVSKFDHCLADLLYRVGTGMLPIDVVGVISNHEEARDLVETAGIPFHHLPATSGGKAETEQKILEYVGHNHIKLVVLARYMQILSDDMCQRLMAMMVPAINIHHSFLPSFKGAKPYHQAHARGVKLIGATAHYVTPDLDEGPIIEQEAIRVDHAHTAEDLVAAGRDVECQVLARAVRWHAENRVMINGSKTIIFR